MQAGERSPFCTAPEQTLVCFALSSRRQPSRSALPAYTDKTGMDHIDDIQPVQVLDFSRERMADRSTGILEFSVNHDFQDANVFHFWERYTSNG